VNGRLQDASKGGAVRLHTEALSSCCRVFIFQSDTYRTRSAENFRIRCKEAGSRVGQADV